MQEKIIETKICKHCNSNFEITDKDLEFYDKVSPVFGGKKYSIPTPTLCSDCRQKRRLSFRNERKLYKTNCSLSGKDMISIYSPDKIYKVYNHKLWWQDELIPLKYGRDYDFNKSFFKQFNQLKIDIPRPSLHIINNENCDFVNQCGYSKSCYLSYNTDYSENCNYCKNVYKSKNCIDCLNIDNCENCYYSVDINSSYKIIFSQKCNNSNNLYFCYNLTNCNNCFGCVNLINKNYHIFNIEYSKNEYELKLKKLINGSYLNIQEIIIKFIKLKLKFPQTQNIVNCENVTGDNLQNSKNLKYCFDCFSDEDIAYCNIVSNGKNIYDFDVGGYESELNLEMVSSGDKNFNCIFCSNIWGNTSNLIYCDLVVSSKNLFGCIGLRNKEYCVFNKQYTKQEYEILVPKIIEHMKKTGEWGEFFPSSISPFGYNETVAQEYFPLAHPNPLLGEEREQDQKGLFQFTPFTFKGENIEVKFNWSDYEQEFPKVSKIIPASKLPENIKDIPDDILNRAIECEITKKPFRIIKQELEFYRKHNLPIPRRHPDQRHLDRMKLRNPRKLFNRKCDKCGIDMKTTYNPERPEIVYCENCYNKEIY